METDSLLHGEQNGFRSKRSRIDRLSSLTNIIDTIKKCRLSHFACFTDFRKVYDTIPSSLLYAKLQDISIDGKLFQAIQTVYQDYKCCVKINELMTN